MTDFEQFVFAGPVAEGSFEPICRYDSDGDCIEFLVSNESYFAKSLGCGITLYVGRETGNVIGGLISRTFQNPMVIDQNGARLVWMPNAHASPPAIPEGLLNL